MIHFQDSTQPYDYREVGDETTAWVRYNFGNGVSTDFIWAAASKIIAAASITITATLFF